MAISVRPGSGSPGITLIEVLISLVIFSVALGLSSRFIAAGMQHPFIKAPVDPWLLFISHTEEKLGNLPANSILLQDGKHPSPFPELTPPTNLQRWSLEWEENSLGQGNALFEATNKDGKKIQWRIFR
ncbi:MAG: hypothetical protein COB67_11405 [SAR324 cluster bacterium]|uniref:Prepilin-type N-terminal cleavage/methylation domain-containing protein n=1 Tax=SAR324 cluster bacterium TaxID=2024889 RepID=A0A2A4STV3_9DELT|nr:MAG: hypothetical protein COB67_11405 [SAR324 cluster bacterium]